jgi:endonuclease III
MSKRSNGPRQPLSQHKPKVVATRERASKPPGAPGSAAPRPGAKGSGRRSPLPAPRSPLPQRATEIYDRLAARYPDARCALDHRNAFELLVATILSAQCTDKRVNMVTPALFARYPDARALAAARQEDVEALVKSTGFYRNKAKNVIAMANALVDRHGGEVPPVMDALTTLPGVGRKTANVILGNAFGRDEGIVVDTHVARVSQRLGLAVSDDPVKIEQALMPLFPRERWTMLAHLFIEHGRQICEARKPKCEVCPLNDLCPSSRV